MKKLLSIVFLLIIMQVYAQEKIVDINGRVFDKLSKERINGVKIEPCFSDSVLETDEDGKFFLRLPKSFRDTIVFNHPDYFTHYICVKSSTHHFIQQIGLTKNDRQYDTICYAAFEGNVLLKGDVVDDYRKKPVQGAVIHLEDRKKVSYTDKDGRFEVWVPKSNKTYYASHPEFLTVSFKFNSGLGPPGQVRIRLPRVQLQKEDTAWKAFRHQMMIAPNELFTGGVGIRFQFYAHPYHAVGLHFTAYLFGNGRELFSNTSKFEGFKVSPFYRIYVSRKPRQSGFFEAKFSYGQFNFENLHYDYSNDPDYGTTVEAYFTTIGGSLGGGWSMILPKTKNGIFTVYIGLQYFPMDVPKTMESEHYGTLEVSNNWWYFYGPGSILEIKLLFGGIF